MKKIQIQEYADGRWGFDDYSQGQRRMVRCKTRAKAQARAIDIDVLMANGRVDLLQSNHSEWKEFLAWKASAKTSPSLADTISEFIALKTQKSSRYQRALKNDLNLFADFIGGTRQIGEVKALEIQRFINSRNVAERRQLNLRNAVISLFRWARRMSFLDPERTTEAEKVEPIMKTPGKPNVLTPEQMRTLLGNIREDYLPWLCVAAFAGIRTEEIAPDRQSKKSPLKWEDFDWQHQVIVIREETSKVRQEREVPIPDNLAQWLAPYRVAKGPICMFQPTNNETRRVGKTIGGWKHNCLRDSFCSYRTRITQNVHQTSYEMGNSPAMVKRSYHKRQSIQEAQEWFDIRPLESANVVLFA